jgi:hypothetical protein
MLELKQTLEIVERTKDRYVIREKPHYISGSAFILGAVAVLALAMNQAARVPLVFLSCLWISFGLGGLLQSTFSVDRKSGIFQVRRQILGLKAERHYGLADVKRAVEQETLNGGRLQLELADGRRKNLTISTKYFYISEHVAVINEYINTSQRHLAGHVGNQKQ